MIVTVIDSLHWRTKFEVSSFNRSRDMNGVKKIYKVGHVTTSRPLWSNFTFYSLVPAVINLPARVSRSNIFRDMERSKNLKSRPHDTFSTPFDIFDIILHFFC